MFLYSAPDDLASRQLSRPFKLICYWYIMILPNNYLLFVMLTMQIASQYTSCHINNSSLLPITFQKDLRVFSSDLKWSHGYHQSSLVYSTDVTSNCIHIYSEILFTLFVHLSGSHTLQRTLLHVLECVQQRATNKRLLFYL